MEHTLYHSDSGEIVGTLSCPTDYLNNNIANMPPNISLLENGGNMDGTTYYYDLVNTIRLRPEITAEPNQLTILANSPDQFLITGLPTTHPDTGLPLVCKVTVEDAGTYEIGDGAFGFATPLPGTYKVKAECFPYITKEWEVTAI